jgi:spore coat protein U-like protein
MSNKRLALLSVLGAALVATPVLAVTVVSNLNVTANVPGGCSVSTTPVAFGEYSGTQVDSTGGVTANCTSGLAYTVELGPGNGGGAVREMTNAGDVSQKLTYELYKDSGRTAVWGGTTYTAAGASALTGQTGSGTNQGITVYGRVPGTQSLFAGSFSDTVVVSLIY